MENKIINADNFSRDLSVLQSKLCRGKSKIKMSSDDNPARVRLTHILWPWKIVTKTWHKHWEKIFKNLQENILFIVVGPIFRYWQKFLEMIIYWKFSNCFKNFACSFFSLIPLSPLFLWSVSRRTSPLLVTFMEHSTVIFPHNFYRSGPSKVWWVYFSIEDKSRIQGKIYEHF